MLHLLLLIFILVSFAVSFSIIIKMKIEDTLAFSIFFIVFILYIFGFFGLLKIGLFCIYTLSGASFIFLIYNIFKRKVKINIIITPGMVMFFILCILSYFANKGRVYGEWDEYAFWGQFVKIMDFFDYLYPIYPGHLANNQYVPGVSIFQYFVVKIFNEYSEGTVYLATNTLMFSLMLPCFKNFKFKNIFKTIIVSFMLFLVPLAFKSSTYFSIYVDCLLGIVFSYILVVYFTNEKSIYRTILLSFAILYITLVKEVGLVFGLISIGIIYLDNIEYKDINKIINSFFRNLTDKYIISLICVLFLTRLSWNIFLNIREVESEFASTIGNIWTKLFDNTQNNAWIIYEFYNKICNGNMTNYPFGLNYYTWLIILFFVSKYVLSSFHKNDNDKNRYRIFSISTLIFGLLYQFLFLILYIYKGAFPNGVDSFQRYLYSYIIGIFLAIVSIIVFNESKDNSSLTLKKQLIGVFLFIIMITNIRPVFDFTVSSTYSIQESFRWKKSFFNIKRILDIVDLNDKVYILSLEGGDSYFFYLQYNIRPIMTNRRSLEINPDIDSDNILIDDWAKELYDEYQYVYVFNTNELFNESYKNLFCDDEIDNDTIYRVNKNEGKIQLEKIDLDNNTE